MVPLKDHRWNRKRIFSKHVKKHHFFTFVCVMGFAEQKHLKNTKKHVFWKQSISRFSIILSFTATSQALCKFLHKNVTLSRRPFLTLFEGVFWNLASFSQFYFFKCQKTDFWKWRRDSFVKNRPRLGSKFTPRGGVIRGSQKSTFFEAVEWENVSFDIQKIEDFLGKNNRHDMRGRT